MLIILSPTKTTKLIPYHQTISFSNPFFLKESEDMVKNIQKLSLDQLKILFKSSYAIAEQNYEIYKKWDNFHEKHPACFLYFGEAFKFLNALDFSGNELEYLNQKTRILSGLYGVLKPLDLIQPYRFEMGSKMPEKVFQFKSLYDFWKEKITKYFIHETSNCLINLASDEYSSSIDFTVLKIPIIQPVFKEFKAGKFEVISIFSKQARGSMCRFIVKNQIKNWEQIKLFNELGYEFDDKLSNDAKLVFVR